MSFPKFCNSPFVINLGLVDIKLEIIEILEFVKFGTLLIGCLYLTDVILEILNIFFLTFIST